MGHAMTPGSNEIFPAPIYKDTVLAPLFEAMKRDHWRHLMRLHRAHGVMLAEQGLLAPAEIAAILEGLDTVEAETAERLPTLVYTGEHEDFFFYVESRLKALIGAETAGRLHTGRSRNDIDHTLFKMALKDRMAGLYARIADLQAALLDTATRHAGTLVVAYTHGQPAQPTTWGHYLCALVETLFRDVERLAVAYDVLDRSSMGAAAITTTGFPLDRKRMADLLGFRTFQENAYGCIAGADYTMGVYAAMKVMFLNLGRFVQDLNQWTGFEVGHLVVPDGFVQKSSIMPQKRNPVPVEHLRLMCSLGAGHCDTAMLAMHNTPFIDMNDNEHEVHDAGYAAFHVADRALPLLGAFVAAASIDGAKVRAHIDASCMTITEVADSLVRTEAISFGAAHQICSALSRRMIAAGETLATLPFGVFAASFADAVGRAPTVSEGDFRRFGTPEHFVAVRTLPGGPAPAALAASLAGYRRSLEDLRGRIGQAHAATARAADDLAAAVARHGTAKG